MPNDPPSKPPPPRFRACNPTGANTALPRDHSLIPHRPPTRFLTASTPQSPRNHSPSPVAVSPLPPRERPRFPPCAPAPAPSRSLPFPVSIPPFPHANTPLPCRVHFPPPPNHSPSTSRSPLSKGYQCPAPSITPPFPTASTPLPCPYHSPAPHATIPHSPSRSPPLADTFSPLPPRSRARSPHLCALPFPRHQHAPSSSYSLLFPLHAIAALPFPSANTIPLLRYRFLPPSIAPPAPAASSLLPHCYHSPSTSPSLPSPLHTRPPPPPPNLTPSPSPLQGTMIAPELSLPFPTASHLLPHCYHSPSVPNTTLPPRGHSPSPINITALHRRILTRSPSTLVPPLPPPPIARPPLPLRHLLLSPSLALPKAHR
ncbi:unnamed protein product [Closterium sp. NIES-65]|nr:unnamed protein product [Closterium sp. NIES-65]